MDSPHRDGKNESKRKLPNTLIGDGPDHSDDEEPSARRPSSQNSEDCHKQSLEGSRFFSNQENSNENPLKDEEDTDSNVSSDESSKVSEVNSALSSAIRTVTAAEAAILAESSIVHKQKELFDGFNSSSIRTVTLEEAVRLTGQGKFHLGLLLVSGCLVMSGVLETVVIGYLLPSASCELGMRDSDKGLLGAASYVGIVLSSHTWGLIADTQGRRKALLWATLLDVVASLASSLAPNFVSLLVLRFLCGVFTSAPAALSFAYLGEFHTPATRSRSIIWIGAFPSIGLLILPGVAWAVLPQTWTVDLGFINFSPWRLLLVLCALISLFAALLLKILMPESPKFLSSKDQRKAIAVLRRMYALNTGNPEGHYPVDQLIGSPSTVPTVCTIEHAVTFEQSGGGGTGDGKSMGTVISRGMRRVWKQTAPLFKPPYLLHTMLVCLIQFGNLASANGLQIWLPEIFNSMAQYEEVHVDDSHKICDAYQFAAMSTNVTSSSCNQVIKDATFINNLYIGVASLLAPVVFGTIVNTVGKRNLLVFCLFLTGSCGIALTVVTTSELVLVLSSIIVAINAMGIGHISSIVVEMFPTHLRAMAVSLHLMCGRTGSIVGNLIFGALLRTQCPYAFYAIGGALIACGFLSMILPSKGKFAA